MDYRTVRVYEIGCTTIIPIDRWEGAWSLFFRPADDVDFSVLMHDSVVKNVLLAMNASEAMHEKHLEADNPGELVVSQGFTRIVAHIYSVDITLHGRHKLHIDRAYFEQVRNLISYMGEMEIQETPEPDYEPDYDQEFDV